MTYPDISHNLSIDSCSLSEILVNSFQRLMDYEGNIKDIDLTLKIKSKKENECSNV